MVRTPTDKQNGISRLIRRGRRRIRLVWLAATASRVGPITAGLVIVIASLGWWRPWFWPEPVALGSLALVIVGLVGWALFMRLPDSAVARSLDKGLKTDDALTAALEVSDDDRFGPSIQKRATGFVDADIAQAIPVPVQWKRWAITTSLLLVFAALVVVTNPQDARRTELVAEQEAIETAAENIEEIAEQLENTPDADIEQATIDRLNALAEEVRKSDDPAEAVEALEDAQAELLKELGRDELSERAASDGLQQTLEQNPVAAGDTAAEQLEAAAKGIESLTEQEQRDLADRLDDLAETQQEGDPETAASLNEAADALRSGDTSTAAEALDRSATSANETADSVAKGKKIESAAGQVGDEARALEPDSDSPGDPSDGRSQQAGATPEGQNQPGQGQTGEGQTGEGQSSQPGAGGQQPGSSPGSGEDGPTVLIPEGGDSDILGADGEQTGSGTVDNNQRVNGPTGSGTVEVELSEVANEFAEQAGEAVDRSSLAPSEASTVERYFEALQEQRN